MKKKPLKSRKGNTRKAIFKRLPSNKPKSENVKVKYAPTDNFKYTFMDNFKTEIKKDVILINDIWLPNPNNMSQKIYLKKGDVVFLEDIYFEKPFVVLGFKIKDQINILEGMFSTKNKDLKINSKEELMEFASMYVIIDTIDIGDNANVKYIIAYPSK